MGPIGIVLIAVLALAVYLLFAVLLGRRLRRFSRSYPATRRERNVTEELNRLGDDVDETVFHRPVDR